MTFLKISFVLRFKPDFINIFFYFCFKKEFHSCAMRFLFFLLLLSHLKPQFLIICGGQNLSSILFFMKNVVFHFHFGLLNFTKTFSIPRRINIMKMHHFLSFIILFYFISFFFVDRQQFYAYNFYRIFKQFFKKLLFTISFFGYSFCLFSHRLSHSLLDFSLIQDYGRK